MPTITSPGARVRPPLVAVAVGVLTVLTVLSSSAAGLRAAAEDQLVGPVNGGFEEAASGAAIPGWERRGGTEGGASVVTEPVAAGEQSVQLEDPEDDRSYGLMSERVPVSAGHSYQLSLQLLPERGAPTVYVYFYDAEGAQLVSDPVTYADLAVGEWSEVVRDVQAPENAASAAIYLYSQIERVSTFYADEVTMRHIHAPVQLADLGPAFYSPNVRLSEVDLLADGTPVGYLFSDGQPVTFNVVDLRTGQVLDSHHMNGYSIAASIEIAPDDTVYFSVRGPNDGSLWSYHPGTQQVERLAAGVVGEDMLRSLVFDDGVLYGSTYPNAKVFSFDPATGTIRDYGSVVEQGSYAWGFDRVQDALWVGTGTTPQLVQVDPESGAITRRELPAAVGDGVDFITRVKQHEDLALISYSPAGEQNTEIFDLGSEEWIGGLEGTVGPWTSGTLDGRFFYADEDSVQGFDVADRQPVSIGWETSNLAGELEGTTGLALVDLGTSTHPGTTLVGVRSDGHIWRYDVVSGSGDVIRSDIVGAPATVHSVGVGGDGEVYFGAYLSAGVMARVDSGTEQVEQLSGPKQADSIVGHQDRTVVGSYPGAEFHVADADQEWDWGSNPEYLFGLGRHEYGQDRPLSMVSAGDCVAAGTIPNYGELGGALTLFDPAGGEPTVFRDVVADQSITALAYRDGFIYGGTSIHGGLDSTPTQDEAELFVWDTREDRRVQSSVVVPGAEVIGALAFDAAGRLWGLADDGVLFEYDPVASEVVRSVATSATSPNIWGRQSELYRHPGSGDLYGNADGQLFRVDPDTMEFTTLLPEGARHSAVHADGDIYLADETNIYRYVP